MTLDHVEAVATKRAVVVPALVASHDHDFGAPLPAWFQLSDLGQADPGAVRQRGRRRHRRRRRFGPGTGHLRRRRPADRLGARHHHLVTRARAAAPAAARASSSETGSVLSHLAILAREAGVPTVVGYAGAADDLPEGAIVDVDGETGAGHHRGQGGPS